MQGNASDYLAQESVEVTACVCASCGPVTPALALGMVL
jgi:hypothetical protein